MQNLNNVKSWSSKSGLNVDLTLPPNLYFHSLKIKGYLNDLGISLKIPQTCIYLDLYSYNASPITDIQLWEWLNGFGTDFEYFDNGIPCTCSINPAHTTEVIPQNCLIRATTTSNKVLMTILNINADLTQPVLEKFFYFPHSITSSFPAYTVEDYVQLLIGGNK